MKEIGLAAVGILTIFLGGLFITGIMAAAPEVFATWCVVRSGPVAAGTTSVIGDNALTMMVTFFSLGLVTVPVNDFQLF